MHLVLWPRVPPSGLLSNWPVHFALHSNTRLCHLLDKSDQTSSAIPINLLFLVLTHNLLYHHVSHHHHSHLLRAERLVSHSPPGV